MKTSNLIEALHIIQKYDKDAEVYSDDNKILAIGMDMLDKINDADLKRLDELGFHAAGGEFENSVAKFFM